MWKKGKNQWNEKIIRGAKLFLGEKVGKKTDC